MDDEAYARVKREMGRIDRELKAAALEAEGPAVYNLRLIRELEKQNTELERRIEALQEISQVQIKRLTDTRAIVQLNEYRDGVLRERIRVLECTLADARRDHADLVKLVGRMGEDLDGYIAADYGTFATANPASRFPYTVIGQREYDAAMHEAEGAPPDAGMLEGVQ